MSPVVIIMFTCSCTVSYSRGEDIDIDKLFTGEKQIQKKKQKRSSDPFSVGSVARETIEAKLAAEDRQQIATLIDLRFGHGTWQLIINERANRL